MSQKVLITGASSGFGLLTTNTLLDAGYTVVASMRDPNGRNKEVAEQLKTKGAKVVEIDVTSEESVEAGVKSAIELADGIDVLINNAGVGAIGHQESFNIDDWQKIFDLNVFGVQRMNRAILPYFRDKGKGMLLHVSSLLGRFVLPFMGPYNASKSALESMADNYRVELAPLGIESLIVEPGGFGTDFAARLLKPSDTGRGSNYGELATGPEQQAAAFEQNLNGEDAPNPQMVADAILKLLETPRGRRPFRTVVDGLGMGGAIEQYNKAADQTTSGIYNAIGMAHMLELK